MHDILTFSKMVIDEIDEVIELTLEGQKMHSFKGVERQLQKVSIKR